jgi:ATP-dependent protease ClpP protease subunit
MYKLLFFFLFSKILFGQKIITLKKNNFISVNDVINNDNVNKWIRDLNNVNTSNIYVYINSPGGDVDAGQLLINQFKYQMTQNKTINCIAQNAYSMAFHLFQNCNGRYITLSSQVMQHQISLGIKRSNYGVIKNYLEMVEQISNNLEEISAARINIDIDEYKNKIINEWWIYGLNIISHNIADEIVIIGCSNELYKISKTIYEDEFNFNTLTFSKIKKKIDECPL